MSMGKDPGPVLHIRCKRCGFAGVTESGQLPNINDVVRCGCCSAEHNHDEWQERGEDAPCRPIDITYVGPLTIHVGMGAPQATDVSGKVT
jgi:hypothetical protein